MTKNAQTSELAIECRELQKHFKVFEKAPGIGGSLKALWRRKHRLNTAVAPFDLKVKKGELVGLLGPNGAGKTTLMKMFTGIIVPSGGQLKVVGHEPQSAGNGLSQKKLP